MLYCLRHLCTIYVQFGCYGYYAAEVKGITMHMNVRNKNMVIPWYFLNTFLEISRSLATLQELETEIRFLSLI